MKAYLGAVKCSGTSMEVGIIGPDSLSLNFSCGVLVISFVNAEGFYLDLESSLWGGCIAHLELCLCLVQRYLSRSGDRAGLSAVVVPMPWGRG